MKKTIALILCIIMISSSLAISAFAQSGLSNFQKTITYTQGKFTDVSSSDWFSVNIENAFEYGLMKGVSATAFGAKENVRISEAIAIAARLNSIYLTGKADFIEGAPWYQVYVDYAVANGIISKNRFEDLSVYATRYQFAEILAAALPSGALPTINNIQNGQIPDVPSDYSYENVYSLYRAGIITGKTSAGNFNPSDKILRSEMAAIVTRMANESLRVKFTISASTGEISTTATLLTAIDNARQSAVAALESYTTAELAYAGGFKAAGAASLAKAAEYTLFAVQYTKNAEEFCNTNQKYKTAYSDTNNAYIICVQASKSISVVASAPLAPSTDWDLVSKLLNSGVEALLRAQTNVAAIG